MKQKLIVIILLFSIQLAAQVPDSLDVDLPWQVVNMMSCDDTMGEAPKTNDETIAIFLESDSIILDEDDECEFRKKTWNIIDWLNGQSYDYIQVGKSSILANTSCVNDLIIEFDDLPLLLSVEDLVQDMDPSQTYSLSYTDETFDHIVLDEYSEKSMDMYIYNWTSNSICKTNVYISSCEDDVVLDFPETAEVEFNEEPYIVLTLEMLGINIVYPCGSFTTQISLANSGNGILSSQKVGTIVPVKVKVEFDNGDEYTKTINVNVTGTKPQPISMFIEEVSFNVGETIELDVWSEEIPGLVAWQLQLQFENTEILGIEVSDMFEDIPNNILDEDTFRALWSPFDAQAIDAESDATWFSLQLKPQIEGSTYDIFKTANDPWSAIAIDNESFLYEYEADFVFNVAPRNVLNTEEIEKASSLVVYPIPFDNAFTLSNIPQNEYSIIQIYNLHGRLVYSQNVTQNLSEVTLDLAFLESGLYIINVHNGESCIAQKITKI